VIVVAAASEEDRLAFAGAANAELHWVSDGDALAAAVRGLTLPPGDGYAWAGSEAAAMRVSAYWKRGVADHHEDLG
jgi:NADPH-dependent ferric siderophore reductase